MSVSHLSSASQEPKKGWRPHGGIRPFLLLGLAVLLIIGCQDSRQSPLPVAEVGLSDNAAKGNHVGDEACASCHEDLYVSYHQTGMGRSLSRFDPATAVERFDTETVIYNPRFDYYYEVFVRGDTLFQREFRRDAEGNIIHELTYPAEWVIGSGNATRSYLMNVNGHITEMPLTWYVERQRWDLSPAYEQTNFRFSRGIDLQCMTCHNGLPEHSRFTQAHYTEVPLGITCERCHGPGEAHVEARLEDQGSPEEDFADPTIVNPARLERSLQLDVCQQCHLTGITVFKHGEGPDTYTPGEPLAAHRTVWAPGEQISDPERFGITSHAVRLAQSLCFEQSEMTCTTCHDPHQPVASLSEEHFNQVCQSCHTPSQEGHEKLCSRPEASDAQTAMEGNCIGCHLRKGGTSDIPHVTFTDHWIRRQVPPPTPPEGIERIIVRDTPFNLVMVESMGREADNVRLSAEEVIADYEFYETRHRLPDYLSVVIENGRRSIRLGAEGSAVRLALGRALADVASLTDATEVLAEAARDFPSDARVQYWYGNVLMQAGEASSALDPLRKAVSLQPAFSEARIKLAEALSAVGQFEEAEFVLIETIERDPAHNPEAWNNLGFIYLQGQRLEEAATHFERAIALDPDLAVAWVNAGSTKMLSGDLDGAVVSFERALALTPDNVAAMGNLGLIYMQQGRQAEARSQFESVLRLSPGDPRAQAMLLQLN